MLHPASELRYVNPSIGYGVFATRFIPKGTITWVLDDLDRIIPTNASAAMHPMLECALEKYSYLNARGERILCWDHSRFINHCCNPTSLAPGFDFEIAVRDIQKGEEFTDDYGSLNLETPFQCECGSSNCRGVIGPGDFERYFRFWDELIADAFSFIQTVEQPLWDLVPGKTEIVSILAGGQEVPSCRAHFLGCFPQARALPNERERTTKGT